MRLFERALRRAQIPVSMTKGFNPHPKISFPIALQLGIEGLNEIMELELDKWIKPADLLKSLEEQLPHGISITSSEVVGVNDKSKLKGMKYNVVLEKSNIPSDIQINNLLNQETVNASRFNGKNIKTFNIRPTINNIIKTETGIIMDIKATNQGMARPKEILAALNISTENTFTLIKIVRTDVYIE